MYATTSHGRGFMNRIRHQPWDVLMLGMEWSTGADEAGYPGDLWSLVVWLPCFLADLMDLMDLAALRDH